MTDRTDTSSDQQAHSRITVSQLVKTKGVTSRKLIRAAELASEKEVINSISVAIVDDATIASLHERYLDDPSPTDVLTFDLRDQYSEPELEGEIVVSAETARRCARKLGLADSDEILRYVIHGVLHLRGLDDQTAEERKIMRAEEDRILALVTGSERTIRSWRKKTKSQPRKGRSSDRV